MMPFRGRRFGTGIFIVYVISLYGLLQGFEGFGKICSEEKKKKKKKGGTRHELLLVERTASADEINVRGEENSSEAAFSLKCCCF